MEEIKIRKKVIVVPQTQNISVYNKQDEKLQQEQNDLILRNTKWAIVLGVFAIIAQIGEILATIFYK